ncbi:MAG TPA: ABC transporter substrate-binding protein [Polyangiaceae bacterium]|jgi:branched-chain amino acid transport system substrate-binding protein
MKQGKTRVNAIGRRDVLTGMGLGAVALGGGPLIEACRSLKSSSGGGGSDVVKIGYISPQTGALASFALADNFVVKQVNQALSKGITSGGKTRTVEIIVKDSQSNPNRAADVARDLINADKVDLVLASSTPDTTNPVSDQCEANGMPNVTTIVPWEAWFFGRGKKPGESFQYSTMFFFGMEAFTDCFISMWNRMHVSNKNVACLWPNDVDANAFRRGFPPAMAKASYVPIAPTGYENGTADYSAQISTFKNAGAQLFTCTPIPPDFNTFWKQAAQQGYRPKLATVAKVMLFPSEAEALGELSNNIATDIWWSPGHPYKSSLSGQSAGDLASAFTAETGKQWTQALGSIYSLFEIAAKGLAAAADPHDRAAVAHALKTLKYEGMSGPLDFTAGPQPGIAMQKIVGGQWRKGKSFPWDIYIVDNSGYPAVPLSGDLQPTFS